MCFSVLLLEIAVLLEKYTVLNVFQCDRDCCVIGEKMLF